MSRLKPVLFFALTKSLYRAGELRIVQVTTHKPKHFWGRDLYDESTHGRTADIIGRRETLEAAQEALSLYEARWKALTSAVERAEADLKHAREYRAEQAYRAAFVGTVL